jgi:hypothetical protein
MRNKNQAMYQGNRRNLHIIWADGRALRLQMRADASECICRYFVKRQMSKTDKKGILFCARTLGILTFG